MVDPAESSAAAYGEPNDPTRTAATGSTVTELLLYRRPEGNCYYPWLEDYLTWLEGKEEYRGYHAWLEQTPPWWKRSMLVGSGVVREPNLTAPSYALETHEWMSSQSPEAADSARRRSHMNPSAAMDLADTTVEDRSNFITELEPLANTSPASAQELTLDRR